MPTAKCCQMWCVVLLWGKCLRKVFLPFQHPEFFAFPWKQQSREGSHQFDRTMVSDTTQCGSCCGMRFESSSVQSRILALHENRTLQVLFTSSPKRRPPPPWSTDILAEKAFLHATHLHVRFDRVRISMIHLCVWASERKKIRITRTWLCIWITVVGINDSKIA